MAESADTLGQLGWSRVRQPINMSGLSSTTFQSIHHQNKRHECMMLYKTIQDHCSKL
jgi:hypothetical protein